MYLFVVCSKQTCALSHLDSIIGKKTDELFIQFLYTADEFFKKRKVEFPPNK